MGAIDSGSILLAINDRKICTLMKLNRWLKHSSICGIYNLAYKSFATGHKNNLFPTFPRLDLLMTESNEMNFCLNY